MGSWAAIIPTVPPTASRNPAAAALGFITSRTACIT